MVSLETLILGCYRSINAKMSESKLLVKTTLGTSILDLESRVDVHLNKDIYLKKLALDLNLGDSVFWDKEYIETTIDKVDPLLELSPRYMHAKMQVNEKNSKNDYVPLLRTDLWRGILNKKGSYNSSLEGIIKKEAEDFCNSDYDEAIELIINRLNEDGVEASRATVRGWLKGEIYAPRDWRMFASLSRINPVFKEFDESNQSIDGKYYNYKFFVIARQRIMAYLARMKGEEHKIGEQEIKKEKPDGLNIRLNEEIDIVVKSLMEDKGKDYGLTRIISIEKLHPKHPNAKEVRRNPAHRLTKGIATRDIDLNIKVKGIEEFIQDYFIINDLFSTSLNIYISAFYNKEFEPFILRNNKVRGYQEGIKQLFLHKYHLPDAYKLSHAFKRIEGLLEHDTQNIEYAERVTDVLIKDVFNGKFDEKFFMPSNSYKKLLEAEYKLMTARPRIFREQEIALDEFEDYSRATYRIFHRVLGSRYDIEHMHFLELKELISRFGSKEDITGIQKLESPLKEAHDKLQKIEKRIEERFPLKCTKVYHGGILMSFIENNVKEKKNDKDYIQSVIRDYDLNEFREIFKFRYPNAHKE